MRSRSDTDPVAIALTGAAQRIIAAVSGVAAANPVVLIDGRSGAGKSTLAHLVARRWPLSGRVQSIAMDSLYPGWDGLAAGTERALDGILRPHGRGEIGTWHRWDWQRGEDAEIHAVDPALGVILEGCGTITPETARLSDVRVWVESPDDARRVRALERDGDDFRPHWDAWAAQEDHHIRMNAPRTLATLQISVP